MRTVQEIFNLAIESGAYANAEKYDEDGYVKSSRYMCIAVEYLARTYKITAEEYEMTKQAIENYLKGFYSLASALIASRFSYKYEATLAIYEDWNSKPKLTVSFEQWEAQNFY